MRIDCPAVYINSVIYTSFDTSILKSDLTGPNLAYPGLPDFHQIVEGMYQRLNAVPYAIKFGMQTGKSVQSGLVCSDKAVLGIPKSYIIV